MSDSGRLRGEYAKTAQRRHDILEAGVQVFASGGFRSGSIREIADLVGMSQAGLLHHFSSKSELLQAVLTHRDDRARVRMGLDVGDRRGVDLLRGYVDLIAFNATEPGLVALFCVLSAEATSPDHPAHAYFRQRYDFVLDTLRTAFEQAREVGELVAGVDPQVAARMVVAASDGLQVQWLLDPAAVDMAAELRRYLQSLVTVSL